jgi:hypothetical protein
MRKSAGILLLGLGMLFLVSASLNARSAPNLSYLMGTFLPGLLFLIFGLLLRREDIEKSGSANDHARVQQFKERGELGILVGVGTMFLGSGLGQQDPDRLLMGIAVSLIGSAAMLWGCVNYMRWKGYSGWFGVLGYLLLPGLIALACFPNRRKQLIQQRQAEDDIAVQRLIAADQASGWRYMLMLLPLGLIFLGVASLDGAMRSNLDPAEWQLVERPDLGFQVQMPGVPRLDQNTQPTPSGNVQVYKFSVMPKGKKELFMLIAIRFPESINQGIGGSQGVLALGRQDLMTSSQGKLKSESQIELNGYPGLEMEVLPPKGAIIKSRMYATDNQLYQASIHVPKIRLESDDVHKFFDSLQLAD